MPMNTNNLYFAAHLSLLYSLTAWYARLIFRLFIFLSSAYKLPTQKTFVAAKHERMVSLSVFASHVFRILVMMINKKTKNNYTISVDYQGCKLLIRPFIFSEVLLVSGLWEPYVRSTLEEAAKDDVIVEVGANIGIYAVPLAKRVRKVIAFEPHPKTAEILERTIKLNSLNNIVLVKRPVADSKRKVLFGLAASPMDSGINASKKIETIIKIEGIDLDAALIGENRVDWLLIDVEGFEVDVLKGASTILRKYHPKIIIEIASYNVKSVNVILKAEGYLITYLFRNYYFAYKK
jgi:FkbM family methyltransferase